MNDNRPVPKLQLAVLLPATLKQELDGFCISRGWTQVQVVSDALIQYFVRIEDAERREDVASRRDPLREYLEGSA